MNGSPSRYGGIAAVMVLGIGLLFVGHMAAGLGVLAIGLAAFALMLRPDAVNQSTLAAIIAIAITAVFLFRAISAEITGEVTLQIRRSPPQLVMRSQSPAKFREVIDGMWAGAILTSVLGTILYCGLRKAEQAEYEL